MPRFVGLIAALAVACNLVSTDVGRFALTFPIHDFRIDSADWQIVPTGQVPAVPCDTGCAAARSSLCGASACQVDCDDATATCQLHVDVLLRSDFDLSREAPELKSFGDHKVIGVSLDDVFFNISENTLNVMSPTLYVYFAPVTVTSPSESLAHLVGIIDPVAPGRTGRVELRFDGNGRGTMVEFMNDFHSPFRVFVSGRITAHSGEAVPAGRLVGSVMVDAHAGV